MTEDEKKSADPRPRKRAVEVPKKGGSPLFSLLKIAAVAGAGFVAARALRRRGVPAVLTTRALPPAPEPVPEEPRTRKIESLWLPGAGGSLHLLSAPSGEASEFLLFVHGLGGSAEQWRPILEALPPHVEGIALDLPGHGASDPAVPGSGALSMEDLAAAVGAVADGLGRRQLLVIGHSLGAAVAVRWAALHGPRVSGLLLVDPNGDPTRIPEDERRSYLETLERDPHRELGMDYRELLGRSSSPEVTDRVLLDLEATAGDTLVEGLAASFAYSPMDDLDAYLAGRHGPVRCVLSPDNDLPWSLHRLRPGLEVAILRNAGHWIMLDDPQALLQRLGDFIDASGPSIH